MRTTKYPDLTPRERARLYDKLSRERRKQDPEYVKQLTEYRRQQNKKEYDKMKNEDPVAYREYNNRRAKLSAASRQRSIERGDDEKYKKANGEYYQTNRTKCLQQSANRRKLLRSTKQKYATYLFEAARARARRKKLEFTIQVEDITVPDTCPILGIELVITNEKQEYNSPSLDRIDTSRGYVFGNVHVISWRANRLKCDATLLELQRMYEYFAQIQNVTAQ